MQNQSISKSFSKLVSKISDILTQQHHSPTKNPEDKMRNSLESDLCASCDEEPQLETEGRYDDSEDEDETELTRHLSEILEDRLREAKSDYLHCGRVLIPTGMTTRVAEAIRCMAENEPCGLRGCVVIFNLEEAESNSSTRCIGRIQLDPNFVPTFEIILNFKVEPANLLGFLGRFGFKPSTTVISQGFTLVKKHQWYNRPGF